MRLAFCLACLCVVGQAKAAGLVFNENFTILAAKSQPALTSGFSERLLAAAERYRREIAQEWFAQELADGVGKTTISLTVSHRVDKAFTWARSGARNYHVVYLTTSPQQAVGSTLKHEIAHVVLATQFPGNARLPIWLEEGIASRYDDAERIRLRKQITQSFGHARPWPQVTQLFATENVPSVDQTTYAFAVSLTDYLLTLDNRKTLLRFGAMCSQSTPDQALATHYQMQPHELQLRWQHWVHQVEKVAQLPQ
ncbi:MAG TPA: hypothetical protein DCY79_15805 [Planctomycetaceae bacterium]|nr:hypothetical protein [Blastopirellula sp.]HAY81269.1 hypothetical protein [Planctomycetaceae bacterium]